jgi:cytochrome c oxidase subunit 2
MGPDLTHFGSRSTIAAGTAPNTRGYLAGWIADPQHLKPGNRMPPTGLSSEDLQAVVAYLETLR